jgi:hypothetical protein
LTIVFSSENASGLHVPDGQEHWPTWIVDLKMRAGQCWSVVVGGQGSLDGGAGGPVVLDRRVECEEALDDAGPEPGGDSAAVAVQAELALEGPDDGLDALAQLAGEGPARLVLMRSTGPAYGRLGAW